MTRRRSVGLETALVFSLGTSLTARIEAAGDENPARPGEPHRSMTAQIRVPEGFVVERAASPPLVGHPMMACFDDRGRLFAAEADGSNLRADALLKDPPNRILLLEIGSIPTGRDLLEAIVFPSASFVRGYEPYVVATRDGRVHTGTLARETVAAVFLNGSDAVATHIPRDQIEDLQQSRLSIMPQGLDAQLSRDELAGLLAFLQARR